MSWKQIALGGIAEFRNGLNYTKANEGSGLRVINVKDFGNRVEPDYAELGELNPAGLFRDDALLRDGDILFVRSNGNPQLVGRSLLISEPPVEVSFSAFCIRARMPPTENVRFYSYFFRSLKFRQQLSLFGSGTNIVNLNQQVLGRMLVPRPPRFAQDRLVEVMSPYDDLIANNQRRIQLLEQSARLLFKEWFVLLRYPGHEHVKVLDGVPRGWKWKLLGDVALTNSDSFSARSLPPEINYIDISSVQNGRLLQKTRMSAQDAPGRARRRVKDGDVIWSNVRPNLRQLALIVEPNNEDVVSTGFTTLTPATVPSSFLYMAVTTDAFVAHLVNHTTGSSYPAVRPDDFERAELLVPTAALLEDFNFQCEPVFRLANRLEAQNRKLVAARDLLLPRLMDGRLSV